MSDDNVSLSSELDVSWADQEHDEEMLDVEPMTQIACWLLYIDSDGELSEVVCDNAALAHSGSSTSLFSRSHLLQYIHTKKTRDSVKYRLMDVLLYHVDADVQRLMDLVGGEAEATPRLGTLKEVTLQDEIAVPKSLCIFHEVNALYFLFREPPKYDDDDVYIPPKPVLKIHANHEGSVDTLFRTSAAGRRKKTKKVTFSDTLFRHTRKV